MAIDRCRRLASPVAGGGTSLSFTTRRIRAAMLRNYLISLLVQKGNDPVVVRVNGTLLDIEAVTDNGGCIVLVLNEDDGADTNVNPDRAG
jgi:hypothetical protein